jgi:hypothetical protein
VLINPCSVARPARALGEVAAESLEAQTGQRAALNPAQVALQTGLGAISFVEKVGAPVQAALKRAAQGALLGGVGAGATEMAETGELPLLRTP